MENLLDDGIMLLGKTLDDYIVMEQIYRAGIKEIKTKLEILNEQYEVTRDHNMIHGMESRVKSPRSILEKLKKLDLEVSLDSARENLTDIAGIRVITCFIEDAYNVARLLLQQDDVTLIKKKDYIENPKENGYRSLHLIVQVPVFLADRTEHVNVEIQIRTVAMDFWASLEHQIRYKKLKNIPDDINRELKACAEVSAELDRRMQRINKDLSNIDEVEVV